jgi:hypothetical protein
MLSYPDPPSSLPNQPWSSPNYAVELAIARLLTPLTPRFLKGNILASLEAQGLVHKAKLRVPLSTKEDLIDAERQAARKFRRAVLEAQRYRLPIPTIPPAPVDTKVEYFWTIGPGADFGEQTPPHLRADAPPHRAFAGAGAGAGAPSGDVPFMPTAAAPFPDFDFDPNPPCAPSSSTPSTPDPQDLLDTPMTRAEADAKAPAWKWARAEALETQYHKARLLEEANIAERKRIRKERHAAESAALKAQKEEDRREGRTDYLASEQRRMRAIESVKKYAEQTGEDVSDWFNELESAHLGAQTDAPNHLRPRPLKRIDGRLRLAPVPPRANPKRGGKY